MFRDVIWVKRVNSFLYAERDHLVLRYRVLEIGWNLLSPLLVKHTGKIP